MLSEIEEYEVQIALEIISDNFNPHEIANQIKEKPDKISRKGERDPIRIVPKQNIVTYRSRASYKNSDLNEHWNFLKDKIFSKIDILKIVSLHSKILITIIVKKTDRFPALEFENDFLEFCYKIGATIEVDTYE
jgi:hypothetical protein